MKKLILISLLILSTSAMAATAFLKYERTTGQTKQCVYEFFGNEYTITVKAYKLCPLSIQV